MKKMIQLLSVGYFCFALTLSHFKFWIKVGAVWMLAQIKKYSGRLFIFGVGTFFSHSVDAPHLVFSFSFLKSLTSTSWNPVKLIRSVDVKEYTVT